MEREGGERESREIEFTSQLPSDVTMRLVCSLLVNLLYLCMIEQRMGKTCVCGGKLNDVQDRITQHNMSQSVSFDAIQLIGE